MTNRHSNATSLALSLAVVLVLFTACNTKEEPKSANGTPAPAASAPSADTKAPQAAPASGSGSNAIQTQMGMTGDVEVDLLKAGVQEGILTVTLAYRNKGSQDVKLKQIALDDVYFISETEKKKYHVLKDSKGDWIAAPVARGMLGTESGFAATPVVVGPGGKAIVWFKFPAPPETVPVVNLVVPDVMPFDKVPVSR